MSRFRIPWRRHSGEHRSCDPPLALALLLPDDLTEGEFADGIQRALAQSRDALVDRARRNAALADRAEQDEVRRAYLIGVSHAFSEAAAHIDAAVADVFDVTVQRPTLP